MSWPTEDLLLIAKSSVIKFTIAYLVVSPIGAQMEIVKLKFSGEFKKICKIKLL